jgi:hypothetical protein
MHFAPEAAAPEANAYARASAPVPEPWDTSIALPFFAAAAQALPAAAASAQVIFPEPEAVRRLSSSKWRQLLLLFTHISPFDNTAVSSVIHIYSFDRKTECHSAKCIFQGGGR